MPKRVAEVGEGKEEAGGYGVYSFIRDLIIEGKDARFVNKKGRYVINWTRALKCYSDYKSKRNPQFKSKTFDRRKASNGLRSALLNFYKKEGAKEFKEGKKVNEKEEVIERQFQMPTRVLESLFGSDVQLSDDGSENETSSIASEADEKPQVTPTSSDTGFDEAMDVCDDLFNLSAEPISNFTLGDLPVDDSILDNIKTEDDQVDPTDVASPSQMFDISGEEFDSALGEICSNSDNDVDLLGVVQDICPSSGSVKGGLQFLITLTEELPDDDKSGIAHFDGIGDVHLDKINPFTLAGIIPASQQPGPVPVTVSTQAGRWLGMTYFMYVDEIQEVLKQLVKDPALQSLYFALWSQEYGTLGIDCSTAQNQAPFAFQDQGSPIQTKNTQALKVLQLLVYTAAQTDAQQFIQMIFSTSAGKIVFNSYKGRTPLPEDVARANGHDDLALYLQDVSTRLSKEVDSDAQTSTINWLELSNAVNKVQKQCSATKDDDNDSQSIDDDNQSDYFADVETSSCGSCELDVGWSDSDDGEGPSSKDKGPKKEITKKSTSSLTKDKSSEKPAMLAPDVEMQLDNSVDKKDAEDQNYKELFNSKPHKLYKEGEADNKLTSASFEANVGWPEDEKGSSLKDREPKKGVSKKANSFLENGMPPEKPAMILPKVGTHADHAGDKKEYDDENYKESPIANAKPSKNLSNGSGLLAWLYKWRKGEDAATTQQEARVDEAQGKRSFTRRSVPKVIKEETRMIEEHAKASGGQGKTAKPKRHKQHSHWRSVPHTRDRCVLLSIALLAVLAGLKIGESQLLHWAVGNGYTGISKVLMKCGLFVDAPNLLSETPLHVAAKNGFKDLAEVLMQFGSNVNAKTYQQQTPLHLAAWSGQQQVAEVLMQHGSDLKARDDLQRTALHLAAVNGHKQIAEVLIQQGSDVKAQDDLQNTALHYAAQNGHTNAIEVLIQQGSDVNIGGIFGNTPLHLSALNGHQQSTEVLIQRGSNVNAISLFGKTPLQLASQYGYQRIVELLIQHGSDVNARDSSLMTALHLAAKNGHKDIVQLLLQHGSDVTAQDSSQMTSLHLAVKNGHINIVELLIQSGSDMTAQDSSQQTALHLAVKNGHKDIVELLIRHGSDATAQDSSQMTALHLASKSGHTNIVELLIQSGSDVTARDSSQMTALHLAAKNGHEDIVQLLIQYGSDVTTRDSSQQTALHLATKSRHTNIVELLLQSGSDVFARDRSQQTVLHLATKIGHKDIVQLLIQYGSDVTARDSSQQTALHLAAKNGHTNVVEVLIQYGSDLTARDSSQQTAIHLAAKSGHTNIVELLVRHGSHVNAGSVHERTPLHLAAHNGHKQIAKNKMRSILDVNAVDDLQQTALHLAAAHGHKNIAEFLILHGCHINARNSLGQTPLHLAAQNGHRQITEVLIQHGADVKARDESQQTAFDLAAKNGHINIADMLIQYGSNEHGANNRGQFDLHLASKKGHKDAGGVAWVPSILPMNTIAVTCVQVIVVIAVVYLLFRMWRKLKRTTAESEAYLQEGHEICLKRGINGKRQVQNPKLASKRVKLPSNSTDHGRLTRFKWNVP